MSNIDLWRRAGDSYARARAPATENAARLNLQIVVDVPLQVNSVAQKEIAHRFNLFLQSGEGKAALYLLTQARTPIVLYSGNEDGIFMVTYVDGNGIFAGVVTKRSESLVNTSDQKRRQCHQIDSFKEVCAHTAIKRAYSPRGGLARYPTGNNPSKFLDWLVGEINKVAKASPSQNRQITSAM